MLDRGEVYGEFDAAFKPNNQRDARRETRKTSRVVVGVGGSVEIGLNVAGNIQPGADATTLVPTVKYRFYQNEKKDVSVVAGTNVFIPVRNRAYDIGSYSYVDASKTFNFFNGERSVFSFILRPVESPIYKLCGADEKREMSWKQYAPSVFFSAAHRALFCI